MGQISADVTHVGLARLQEALRPYHFGNLCHNYLPSSGLPRQSYAFCYLVWVFWSDVAADDAPYRNTGREGSSELRGTRLGWVEGQHARGGRCKVDETWNGSERAILVYLNKFLHVARPALSPTHYLHVYLHVLPSYKI